MTSIIIPIYNTEAYLPQCLTSLLAQTTQDWEAILVDDASTDDSARIAEEYGAKDARFTLLRQEINKGQSAARNRGLDLARGEYIAFLDADDRWEADYLERHLAAIDGCDMVQSGYRRILSHPSGENETVQEKLPCHKWQFTSSCMRLYRRSAIEGLRFEEGTRYEDVLWTVDLLTRKPSIRMLHYIGYDYRITPGSTTSRPHPEDRKRVMDLLRKKPTSGIALYTRIKLSLFWKAGK